MKSGPDVKGIVSFLSTTEGGRRGYAGQGYRPQHVFQKDWITSGQHQYIDQETVEPGESALAKVWFLTPLEGSLEVGTKLRIQEASKLVGYLLVTEIYNESLAKYS